MTTYRIYVFGLLLLFVTSCAKKVPVSYNNIDPGHYIYATLTSGETVEGEVKTKNDEKIEVIINDKNSSRSMLTREIMRLNQKPPVYDEAKQVIPESLIRQQQKGTNKWLFTLGGSALSLGVSFFITANILHETSTETEGAALWGPTIGGAAVGGLLFGIQGNKLDRRNSIEAIKDQRKIEAIKSMKQNQRKREEVEQELDNLKKQRQQQNEEINRLLKEVNKKKEE
jgi:hypothetical protein